MNTELYQQAVEASKEYALTQTPEGHKLTVVAERYWDETQLELTLEYDSNFKPDSYKLTHGKPQRLILTGAGIEQLSAREVYGVTSHSFH